MKKKSQQIRITPEIVSDVFFKRVEQYAISYARVSTDEQVEGFSIFAQLKSCREAAKKLNVKLLREFEEQGVSGKLIERPSLTEALAFCAKNKDKIAYFIVKDIDRLARDTLVHAMIRSKLRELGIQLYSINQPTICEDNPHARFMENIFSSVAQLEREQIGLRTQEGRREAVLQGAWIQVPPYGYKTTRREGIATLEPHDERAPVVTRMFELYAEGKDQKSICEILSDLGYRTTRGARFNDKTVSCMLRNIAYIGKVKNKVVPGQVVDGLHTPLVSLELWNRVQDRLSGRKTGSKRMKANPHFPLANTLCCYVCGTSMAGSFSTGMHGKKYGYYHCRKKGCKAKSIPYEKVEAEFFRLIKRAQPTEKCVQLFEKDFIQVYREKWQQSLSEKQVLQRRFSELEARREKIEDMFFEAKISQETYDRRIEAVDKDINRVSESKNKHVLSEESMKDVLVFCRKFLISIWKAWESGTVERRRLIQKLVFPSGVPVTKEGGVGNPKLPPLLALIQEDQIDESNMVAQDRFELSTPRSSGECSTN